CARKAPGRYWYFDVW
nr:immunoglobulin heavy chain junction region [Mus musculus]